MCTGMFCKNKSKYWSLAKETFDTYQSSYKKCIQILKTVCGATTFVKVYMKFSSYYVTISSTSANLTRCYSNS